MTGRPYLPHNISANITITGENTTSNRLAMTTSKILFDMGRRLDFVWRMGICALYQKRLCLDYNLAKFVKRLGDIHAAHHQHRILRRLRSEEHTSELSHGYISY